jgi:hypothetical protein
MQKLCKTLIKLGGIFNILGGIFHFSLGYILQWKSTLPPVGDINTNVMLMLNYCLATFFFLSGIVVLRFHHDILSSKLGNGMLFIMAGIYTVRMVLEFILPGGNLWIGGILLLIMACFLLPIVFKPSLEKNKGFSFS